MTWGHNNDVYFVTGGTSAKLPAGTYRFNVIRGQIYINRFSVATDNLYQLEMPECVKVMDQLDRFWKSEEKFRKHGFLFKRGILLYGIPGTGKTSLINMISQKAVEDDNIVLFNNDICSLAAVLRTIRSEEPDRRIIVVLEDVDGIAEDYEEDLLDLLDGSSTVDNVIYIATTNYIEDLEDRLVKRPSRFDLKVEVKPPAMEQRLQYLNYLSKEEKDYTDWAERTEGFTVAHLRELFISVELLGNDLEDTIEELKDQVIEVED